MARAAPMALLMLLLAIAARMTSAATEVPMNFPIQVARPSENHTSLVPVVEGLAQLAKHAGKVALVAVVGPYHSGKSFLLNVLSRNMQTFSVGPQISPETMGIWICRTNMTAKDGSEVWLLDSEGFYGVGIDDGYDAKVFTIAALIGAHVVYNTVKVIDQQSISLLETLISRAQFFRARSSVKNVPEFLRTDSFPPLTWVVEDFVQKLPERFNDDGPNKMLTYLWSSNAQPRVSDWVAEASARPAEQPEEEKPGILNGLFRDFRVHPLFLPATGKEQLEDLSRLKWEELTEQFREEVEDLRNHIVRGLEARNMGGQQMTGDTVANALRFILSGLENGMFPELPSLWDSWARQIGDTSINDADVYFTHLSQNFDGRETPAPIANFDARVADAYDRVTNFYRNLLRNAGAAPRMSELRSRLDTHLAVIVEKYRHHIQLWVGHRISLMGAQYSAALNEHILPTNPFKLERDGQQTASLLVANFSDELRAFATPFKSGTAGTRMPSFNENPVTHLETDLKVKLAARNLENERAISQVFRGAVRAADVLSERILNETGGRMLNQHSLDDIRKRMDTQCMQLFENRLSTHAWTRSVKHFASSQSEVKLKLAGRFSKFVEDNKKVLDASLNAVAIDALKNYRVDKKMITMPSEEAVIDAEHSKLATQARHRMKTRGMNFSDTSSFTNAMANMDKELEKELSLLRKDNVESWTFYSKEATRCASAMIDEDERQHSILRLVRVLPYMLQWSARRHLNTCFAKTGPQMTAALQRQIFNFWYERDLKHHADSMQKVLFVTIFCLVIGIFWLYRVLWFARLGQQYVEPYYYGYGPLGRLCTFFGFGRPYYGAPYGTGQFQQPQPYGYFPGGQVGYGQQPRAAYYGQAAGLGGTYSQQPQAGPFYEKPRNVVYEAQATRGGC